MAQYRLSRMKSALEVAQVALNILFDGICKEPSDVPAVAQIVYGAGAMDRLHKAACLTCAAIG